MKIQLNDDIQDILQIESHIEPLLDICDLDQDVLKKLSPLLEGYILLQLILESKKYSFNYAFTFVGVNQNLAIYFFDKENNYVAITCTDKVLSRLDRNKEDDLWFHILGVLDAFEEGIFKNTLYI
ncbi:MAG: hypothetical protein ACRCXZ_08230 [Patescibacteria group bacterium]